MYEQFQIVFLIIFKSKTVHVLETTCVYTNFHTDSARFVTELQACYSFLTWPCGVMLRQLLCVCLPSLRPTVWAGMPTRPVDGRGGVAGGRLYF